MRQRYTYPTIWEKRVVAIIHIYVVRAFFYYFMITNTLNLSCEKYKWVQLYQYPPIKISNSPWGKISIPHNMGEKCCGIYIYEARDTFLLFCDHQDTGFCHEKWKLVQMGQYAPISSKGPMGQRYPYLTLWENNIVAVIHIYGVRAFFTIL